MAVRRVLLVEAAESADDIAGFLRRSNCLVHQVDRGQRVVDRLPETDILLLGMGSSDTDSLDVCRTIRTVSSVPVIAFTTATSERDRVQALEAGADDCVARDCGHREILARMEAVLRRCRHWPAPAHTEQVLSHGPLRIDLHNREIWLSERRVTTTEKEFELLRALALRPTDVVSRRELMAGVWRCDARVPTRTLDTHVSSLRAKLGSKNCILNVRGVGYRLGAMK